MRNYYSPFIANQIAKNTKSLFQNWLKMLGVILIVLSSATTGWGQALTEDFSYTTGTFITANGWTAISAAGTNAITVTNPSLIYPNSPSSNVGNCVAMTTSGEDDIKTFSPTVSTGTVYCSALINVSAAQTTGDYFIALANSANNFNGRVFIKSSGAGFVLGVSKFSTTATYDGTVLNFGTTYLLVLKYTIVGTNTAATKDDRVDLFISPSLGVVEPLPTLANIGTGVDADIISSAIFDRVALRQGNASNSATLKVDGIRVGTTWASVTPAEQSLSTDRFRSKTSGSWSSTSTWESSHDGTTWFNATLAPDNNANTITILNTHTVTANSAITADQVTVASGGILTASASTLTINDGAGTDLDVSGTLNLSGAFIDGAGSVDINTGGAFNWSAGNMTGSGITTCASGSTTVITGSVNIQGTRNLINNSANFSLQQNLHVAGTPSVFTNNGTIDIPNDASLPYNGGSGNIINNNGTITKSGGAGTSVISSSSVVFNNQGIVNVNSGTFAVSGSGTHTGSFAVASGKSLSFNSGTHVFTGTSAFTGTGNINLSTGSITFDAGSAYSSTLITNENGTVNWNNSPTLGDVTLFGGAMQGTSDIIINGALTWSSGNMQGSGTTTLSNTSTVVVSGSVDINSTRNLINNSSNFSLQGNLHVAGSPSVFTNNGTIDIPNDASLPYNGGSGNIINNNGTITKSGGAGTSVISSSSVVFNNQGIVNVNSGTFAVSGSGTHTGSFAVASGKSLSFTNGTHVFTGTSSFTGTGNVILSAGSITFNAGSAYSSTLNTSENGVVNWNNTPTLGNVTLNGGAMQGSSSILINGLLTWSSGNMQGSGTTTLSNTSSAVVTGSVDVNGTRILINNSNNFSLQNNLHIAGTPSLFTNNGTIDILNDASLPYNGGSGNNIVNNGTITKSVGAGNSNLSNSGSLTFTNLGVVNVNSGSIAIVSNATHTGTFNVAGSCLLSFFGGTQVFPTASAITGSGNVQFVGGIYTFDAGSVYSSNLSTNQVGGDINWNNSPVFGNYTISGGNMQGNSNVLINGIFNWGTAGILNGSGTTTLSNTGSSTITGSVNINGTRNLINNSNNFSLQGNLHVAGTNCVFTNNGIIDIPGDASLPYNGGSGNSIINNGTITKSGGVGNSNLSNSGALTFTNLGIVNVNSGFVTVFTNSTHTGAFNVASGKTFVIGGGTQVFSPTSSITGTGNVQFVGGLFTFDNGSSFSSALSINQGSATVNWNNSPSILNYVFTGGTMQGNTPILINGIFSWGTAGVLSGSNTTTLANTSTVTVTGSVNINGTRNLINNSPNFSLQGNLHVAGANSVFTNNGVIDIPNDASLPINGGFGNIITNNGTITKSGGSGVSHLSNSSLLTFNNAGIVNVNSGTVNLQGTGVHTGTYNIASGKTLTGTITMAYTGPAITNDGNITLSGLTYNGATPQALNGTGNVNVLTVDNGNGVTMNGSQTINNSLTMTNGNITLGAGDLIIAPAATFTGSGTTRYIITTGAGALKQRVQNNNTNVVYHLGTSASSYTPVIVKLSGASTTDNISARVANSNSNAYDVNDNPTGAVVPRSVLKSFFVKGSVPVQDNITVTTQWNTVDQGAGFSPTLSAMAHYTGGAFQYNPFSSAAAGTIPNSFIHSMTGLTSLSPFLVIGPDIINAPTLTEYCDGTSATINYTVTGIWNAGNVYSAELSDASGSFASPVVIGTATAITSGSISATIPANTPEGTGYKIRIVSSDPVYTGDESAAFTIHNKPSAPTASSNSPICAGDDLNLTSSATSVLPITYAWSGPDGFTSALQNPTITAATTNAAGVYTATITNTCGSTSATTTAVVNEAPSAPLASSNSPICAGADLNLTSSATSTIPVTYAWSGPDGFTSALQNPTITAATTNAAGVYTVTITNTCGSTSTTTTAVVNVPPSAPTANSNSPICAGADLNLTSSATSAIAVTYAWSGPDGFTSALQNPTITAATANASGVYTVTITNTCGSTTATTTAVVNEAPSAPTASSNSPICAGVDLNLTSSATSVLPVTYSWSGPDGFNVSDQNVTLFAATTNATGVYTVTVTNACGSTSTTTNVTVNPVASLGTTQTNNLCQGATTGSINLTATGGGSPTYFWTTNVSCVIDGNCNFGGGPNSTCNIGTNLCQSTNEDLNNLPAGTYSVVVTATGGCTSTTSVIITEPNISSDDNNACTIDACDPLTGIITNTPVNIDDNDVCTTDACDPLNGNISHTPVSIDDSNACTADACHPINGITHTLLTYTITASSGSNGSITFPGVSTVNCNDSKTYNFTPDAGYAVDVVLVDGNSVGNPGSYSFSSVTANHTISVSFVATGCVNPATISGGSALPDLCSGSTITLNATIGGTATMVTWTTDGLGVLDGDMDLNPDFFVDYTANASDVGNIVTVTATTDDPDGAGPCSAVSTSWTFTVIATPVVNAGVIPTLCTNDPVFALGGSPSGGEWSGVVDGNQIDGYTFDPASGSGGSPYTLEYNYTANNGCLGTDQAIVTVLDPPVISIAYSGTPYCDNGANASVTQTGTAGGTYNSTPAGLVFANATIGLIDVAATTPGIYTVTYSVTSGGCSAVASTSVEIVSCSGCINPATVDAGPPIRVCETGDVTLGGTIGGSASSITWTTSGDGTFDDATLLTAVYTPGANDISNGTVTLTITTDDPAGPCDAATDFVVIPVDPEITLDAGPDISVCIVGGSVQLGGVVFTGPQDIVWSGGLGTFSNVNDLNAEYIPDPSEAGTIVTLTMSSVNGVNICPPVSDFVLITVDPAAIVDAGPDQAVCSGGTITLAGSVTVGATQGVWTGGLGTFTPDANTLNATYTADPSEYGTTVTLTLTSFNLNNVCVPVSDDMEINVQNVTVDAGPDIHVCELEGSVGLNGVISGGISTGTWSGGLGTFVPNANTLAATYIPDPSETGTVVILTLTSDGSLPCPASSDQIAITVDQELTVDAGPDINVCIDGSVEFVGATTSASVNNVEWVGGAGTFVPDRFTAQSTYFPALSESGTTVTLTLNAYGVPGTVCPPVSDDIVITVDTIPSANAGADQLVCYGGNVSLNGSLYGGGTTAVWSTNGDGTFANATALSTTYTPGANDIIAGTVTLTLTPDFVNVCVPTSDEVVITLNQQLVLTPTITDVTCPGFNDGTASVAVTGGTPTYIYLWNTGSSSSSITGLTPGAYTLTVTDLNLCTNTITVNIGTTPDVTAPAAPVLADATGECSVTVTAPTAIDNCAGTITGTTASPLTYTTQGTFSIIWSFDDGNGNVSTSTQTVIVDDITQPVTPTLADINVGECSGTPPTPTTTDNCAGTISGTTSTVFPITAQGTTVVTWTFDDGNGNFVTANQNVIVLDITSPATPVIPNATGECSVTVTPPTTTDNCAGTVTGTTTDPLVYSTQGTFSILWTFNDGNGNSTSATQTVIVDDITAPAAPVLANATGECSVTVTAPTAVDNCSGTITGTTADPLTYTTQGTFSILWSFDDGNGNVSTSTQTVIVDDITAPAAPVLANATGECSVTVTAPTAIDNCSGTITGTTLSPLTYTTQGTFSIIWSFDDGNGNVSTSTQTVIVDDITAPTAPVIADATGECSASVTAPTALDNCAGTITGTTLSPLTYTTQGTFSIIWSFDDGNGNVSTSTQTVIVDDITAPVAPVIANETGQCSVTVTAPTATDNCVGTVTGTTPSPLTYTTQGTFNIVWTFNDGNGNTSTATQTVIVLDNIAPVPPVIPNATGQCSVTVTAPTAVDNCVGTVTGTTPSPLTYTTQGTFNIVWTFNDGNGNTSTATQTVIVNDNIPPVTPVLPNVNVGQCSGTPIAPITTDNCSGTITGTTTTPFPITAQGTTVVTWTFNDGHGNITTANQNVIVLDVIPPVTPVLATLTGQCSVTVTPPTTSDNCTPVITGTTASPLVYTTQGTFSILWTFNDGHGNSTTATQTVIVDDIIAPVAPVIPNATGECSVTVTAPTATDNCVGTVTGTTASPLVYTVQGTYSILWTFNDGNGNTSTSTQTVIVDDITAPVPPVIANATGQCSVTVSAVPTATDNCVGTVTGTTVSPLTYTTQGTFTIVWTFNDGNGNISTANQTVIVDDITNPVPPVTIPTAIGQCSVTVTPPTATDNCVGTVTGTTPSPLVYNAEGTYIIVWTFNDGNGNSVTRNQTVIVHDFLAPVPPVTIPTATGQCSVTVTPPTAVDNCVGIVTGTTPSPLTYNTQGTFTIVWSFNDTHGNISTRNQTVIVLDNIAPVPPVIATATGECSVTVTPPTATDNCVGTVTGTTASPLTYNTQGTFTIVWSFNDTHGNISTANQTVIVDDITAPVAPVIPDATGQCSVTVTPPTASDNCVGTVTGTTASPLTYNTQGTFSILWTFNDGNGNSSTATQTVIVNDNIPPATPVIANATGECSVTVTPPTTTDDCAGTLTGTTTDPLVYTTQGTFSILWAFNDGNGNSTSATQTVIVDDVTAPAAPVLANATGECSATVSAPTAIDNCAGTITGTTLSPLTYTTQGTFSIIWSFDDGNGNVSTSTQTVIVDDITAPAAPVLANVTGECSATVSAPTAIDNCSGTITGTTLSPLTYNTQGTFSIIWSFDDGNGNVSTSTQTVIVDDVTAPTAPVVADATGECSVTVSAPTAIDNCEGTITGTTASPLTYNTEGTFTILWSFDDGNGNVSTSSQTVIVDDVTAPVAPVIADATGECSVTVTAPTAIDNCAGTITGTTASPLTYNTQGTFSILWTFNDGNGNSSTATQTVIVDDVTAPSAPVIANATGECSVTVIAPTAIDNCTGTITGTTASPLTYNTQGTFSILWSFDDGNGNVSTSTQTVIVDDITAPAAPVIADATGECSVTVSAPTAIDNCSGTITGTTASPLTYNTQGTFSIIWSFDDGNGNVSTSTQTVIVDDVTAPSAPVIADATGECSVTVSAPTAIDNCSGTITGTTASPLTYNTQGTFSIIWSFDDGNGNVSTSTQTVIVDDVTAPSAPVIANSTGECSVTVSAPTAADNCAGTITGTTASPLTYNTQGTFSIIWSFDDGNGNVSTSTQTVIVDDITAPVPPVLSTVTGECSVTLTAPTAADNCAGTITGTTTTTFPITTQGTTVVIWTFNDGNGNSSTANQTAIINDVTNPVISNCPSNINQCNPIVSWTEPTAADNCTIASFNSNFSPGFSFPVGTTTVTYTALDGNGNSATCSFDVTIVTGFTWYADVDGDGYGSNIVSVVACVPPPNYVAISGDCDDTNASINPGATEVCNNIDDNCNGIIDEGVLPPAGPIAGTAGACIPIASGSAVFSIPPIPGATNYNWSIPSNVSISAGLGTNSITISWNSIAAHDGIVGQICVEGFNACGSSASSCITIAYTYTAPVTPPSISGSAKVCPGDFATYSISPVARASFYTWVAPTGVIILSGQGTNVITTSVTGAFTGGTLTVSAGNACGVSPVRTRNLIPNILTTPPAISGPANGVCGSSPVTYSITPVVGANSYTWTVPSGATLLTQTANTITVSFTNVFTSGPITVTANNNCGASPARSLTVTGAPAQPGVITGSTAVCPGATGLVYSVATVPGTTTYTWTVPATATITGGQFTKIITVDWNTTPVSAQVITVKASNNCGTSITRLLSGISVNSANCVRLSDAGINSALQLNAWPNPTQGELNLSFTLVKDGNYTIKLTDMTGRVIDAIVEGGKAGQLQRTLDLSTYSSGIYFLVIETSTDIQKIRILVE